MDLIIGMQVSEHYYGHHDCFALCLEVLSLTETIMISQDSNCGLSAFDLRSSYAFL